MNNKSLRYAKLMKTMGLDREVPEPKMQTGEVQEISPEKIEALTGMEQPEMKEKRRMKMILDNKISELEQSEDPMDLESLKFWKQKRDSLGVD